MNTCPNCATQITDNMNYCPNCGNQLLKICHSCDCSSGLDAKFCVNCGKDLNRKTNILKGDIIRFGNYFINDDKTKEPLEWLVLDVSNCKALLTTVEAIDCKPFNDVYVNISWKYSTIRHWLNNEFINYAFTKEEQNDIFLTNITNSDSTRYIDSDLSDNTLDKVFLLNNDEIIKFMPINYRQCKITKYAKLQGASCFSEAIDRQYLGNTYWWLRSKNENDFARVNGYLPKGYMYAINVDSKCSIRPALFLKL